jgi:hypothetical protein
MLFVGDAQEGGFLARVLALGALFGVARSAKRVWQDLEVERFVGDVPTADYAELGFRPPASGSPRLAR